MVCLETQKPFYSTFLFPTVLSKGVRREKACRILRTQSSKHEYQVNELRTTFLSCKRGVMINNYNHTMHLGLQSGSHLTWQLCTVGRRLFPTYLQGTLKLKGHPDGFWNRPWWLISVLQDLVVSQYSTCSTEWSEIVRGPRSPGKFPCHSSHGFPSSVSPVSNASLTGLENSPCLYWLGINLHMSILNNSQIPLS